MSQYGVARDVWSREIREIIEEKKAKGRRLVMRRIPTRSMDRRCRADEQSNRLKLSDLGSTDGTVTYLRLRFASLSDIVEV